METPLENCHVDSIMLLLSIYTVHAIMYDCIIDDDDDDSQDSGTILFIYALLWSEGRSGPV